MLLSELIELLGDVMTRFGDLNVSLEDDEVGNVMDLHSIKVVQNNGERLVILSDKIEKSIEVSYLN